MGQWVVGERGKGWKWEWKNRYVIDHYLSVHHLHTGHTCRVLETYSQENSYQDKPRPLPPYPRKFFNMLTELMGQR